MHSRLLQTIATFFIAAVTAVTAQTNSPFDGRPWNISSGNVSVSYIQGSPIGAYPKENYYEAPPTVESQKRWKSMGLVANEDYIAWGAVERRPGVWDWSQHDAVEKVMHAAGLKYVVYNWAHFPPVWLREQKDKRTLMRCMTHKMEANYLSIFDPRTIEWYDHFYREMHKHFDDKIDDVYACILGPYGEGNYPLMVPDWVNMGHCHEGYWCGDSYALEAFQRAMQRKYKSISNLNAAWKMDLRGFDNVRLPSALENEKHTPTPMKFPTPHEKQQWLDFITWYHQAIIDFSEQSLKTVLKYFPKNKVRLKPGGNYGSVNPIAWGTYCPGYAKMARKYDVVLQPADCQGAAFGDKWLGTAYQFYGVKLSTEPAGDLDERAFVRRMFSDASCGASQLFSYQFERHAPAIRKYIHLYTGKPGETEIAVFCPTTLYRLGESLQWTIEASVALRDLCEFDVLDELLIADGALTKRRYKTLIVFQADVVDQPIIDKLEKYQRSGGRIILVGHTQIGNIDGVKWDGNAKAKRLYPGEKSRGWLETIKPELIGLKGFDGNMDGLWTCRRGKQAFVFNTKTNAVITTIDEVTREVAPASIEVWNN